jgi:hypothetical protein
VKISITGASNWVNRMFEACGPFQWARETLKNSREAGATRVEFGIEWQAVQKAAVYRRTIADNGSGMSRDELKDFFSTLGAGAKKIAGVHENFGVGAKIATLPWNPEGVVVISYKDGRGSMIWIVLDEDSQEYHLADFDTGKQKDVVIEPGVTEEDGIDWSRVAPDWIKEHGTIVVLLGSKEYPDTILGNPHAGEGDIKGLSVFLNTRFWDLGECEVKVVEPRNTKKTLWPQGPDDKDDVRRANNRSIEGAKFYLTDPGSKWSTNGKLAHSGTVLLDQTRVAAEWYLWEGERPAVHSYAKKSGYLAIRYKGELYEVTAHKAQFRAFGIAESQVQSNLTIVLDPPLYFASNGRWGVYPDQSRNRLLFSGRGEKGVAIPMADWGVEFADNMPEPIFAAIREARGGAAGSIEDEDYRKRLQDKFGDRWTTSVRVKSSKRNRGDKAVDGTLNGEETDVTVQSTTTPPGLDAPPDIDPPSDPPVDHPRTRTRKVVRRPTATPGGPEATADRPAPVDVPRFRLAHKDDFVNPLHLAVWVPADTEGPMVLINVDSPILEEVVAYHQAQYPDVHAEEIADTVRKVYGEIATCKIAHSQKLARTISTAILDRDYRSEEALTVALMGLLAEGTIIEQRLGKLGSKKKAS